MRLPRGAYYFDLKYYYDRNPDLRSLKAGALLLHYRQHGINERRAARYFHPLLYLSHYPDVKAAGVEPLHHYLSAGKKEGRTPAYFYSQLSNIEFEQHLATYSNTAPCELAAFASPISPLVDLSSYRYYVPDRPVDSQSIIIRAKEKGVMFSIVTPLHKTLAWQLGELIASVIQQWYENWELLLVDDGGLDAEVIDLIRSHDNDTRIRLIESDHKNTGISEATNRGIAASSGTHIVFLDHDDTITVDALYRLGELILCAWPDIVYSDEDKIDKNGKYIEPHFKPAWSPDTMMSIMYTCHIACYTSRIIKQLGGLRKEFDGCQDWDLMLRASEITDKIYHIPRVLYHWRITQGSVSESLGAKSYVIDRSKKVRESALKRRNISGTFTPMSKCTEQFNIDYELLPSKFVTIIIPTKNNSKILESCVKSIIEYIDIGDYQIVVIDNGSLVQQANLNKAITLDAKGTYIYHDIKFNFSALCNAGAVKARGDILIFLNDDTELTGESSIKNIVALASLKHIGAVGAKLLYPDGKTVQHCGVVNTYDGPSHSYQGYHDSTSVEYFLRRSAIYNWSAVTGACLAVEKGKFNQVGGFDENLPVAYNDISLCFSLLEAGFYNVNCNSSVIIHHESLSRGIDHQDLAKRIRLLSDRHYLLRKHPRFAYVDPFYSPNHTFNHSTFK